MIHNVAVAARCGGHHDRKEWHLRNHHRHPGGVPQGRKHKSPSKIRRLERRAAERAAGVRNPAAPINWSDEPEVVLTEAQVAEVESGPEFPLMERTMADLKAIAKECGVKGYSKFTAAQKQDLIDAIQKEVN